MEIEIPSIKARKRAVLKSRNKGNIEGIPKILEKKRSWRNLPYGRAKKIVII